MVGSGKNGHSGKKKKRVRVETLNINSSDRVIVIGDIHGCLNELEHLLRAVSFQADQDHLVVVGDIVNKGPDSVGAARLLQRLGAKGVLGNHEQKLLKCVKKLRKKAPPGNSSSSSLSSSTSTSSASSPPSLPALAAMLPRDVEDYLSGLPHILRVPSHNLLVVHAGLHPSLPLDAQSPRDVLEMRNLVPAPGGLVAAERRAGGVAWASLWPGPETVCFGHDAGRGLQRHKYAIGIDTACVRGGELTAVVFPGANIVAVPGWTRGAKM